MNERRFQRLSERELTIFFLLSEHHIELSIGPKTKSSKMISLHALLLGRVDEEWKDGGVKCENQVCLLTKFRRRSVDARLASRNRFPVFRLFSLAVGRAGE